MQTEDRVIEAMADIAISAGPLIMKYFGLAEARLKGDGSPVTLADAEAEALILPALARLMPDTPIIAEEAAAAGDIPETGASFLLVDPLDGTKEFLSGSSEFTVNIGLVSDGLPIAGVIYAPALGKLWLGGLGFGSEACDIVLGSSISAARKRRSISVRPLPAAGLQAVASRSHSSPETEAYLAQLQIAARQSAGSSLKFCLIAEGLADVYPRFSPTMEWDTAAGHAILRAAGGAVCVESGEELRYGKKTAGYRNPGFVAASDCAEIRRRMAQR